MKIKLKANMADASGAHQAGAILVVDDKEGKALIDGGYALEVKPAAAAKPVVKPDAKKTAKPAQADGGKSAPVK